MSSQQVKAKLLAASLFITSVGGTFAIFGCVPMLARLTSSAPEVSPAQFQAFPEASKRQDSSEPAATTSLSYRSKQARALFNGLQMEKKPLSPVRSAQ